MRASVEIVDNASRARGAASVDSGVSGDGSVHDGGYDLGLDPVVVRALTDPMRWGEEDKPAAAAAAAGLGFGFATAAATAVKKRLSRWSSIAPATMSLPNGAYTSQQQQQQQHQPAAEAVHGVDDGFNRWMDSWLTPGSIILHKFELTNGHQKYNDTIESMARDVAAGNTFAACDEANARQRARVGSSAPGPEDEEPAIYLSKDGVAVRVHRDGSTTLMHILDEAFRAERNVSCHVVGWCKLHSVDPWLERQLVSKQLCQII